MTGAIMIKIRIKFFILIILWQCPAKITKRKHFHRTYQFQDGRPHPNPSPGVRGAKIQDKTG
jgi:hypothetical protein